MKTIRCGAALDLGLLKATRLPEAGIMAFEVAKLREQMADKVARLIRGGELGEMSESDHQDQIRFLSIVLRVDKPPKKGRS